MTQSEHNASSLDVLSVIFTFNRPEYLNNLVQSHRDCASEIPLLIIDDASTDQQQIAVLEELKKGEKIEVISASGASHRHGGLYANMNSALNIAVSRGYKFLNLLQDDMQIVRPASKDILHACSILDATEDALQISLAFRKYLDVKNEPKPCSVPYVYLSQNLHAADTGIIHVTRASKTGFVFQGSERGHSARAKSLGLNNYVYRDPLVAFVPWPTYFRNRQPVANKRFSILSKNGEITPVQTMTDLDVLRMKNRDITLLPYMEDWCHPAKGFWLKPYNYTSSRFDWMKRVVKALIYHPGFKRYLPGIISTKSK